MAHQTLTLKYRPKKLSEIIGQRVVVQGFTNAVKSQNLHPAYILAGAFGCGKTSVARIVAAMENCEKGPTTEPCGVCDRCTEIFNGSSIDVRELDAASNRGIDDIRDIRRDIQQCPIYCRVKYLIIDEAHRLTDAAAEAALKMIEEPPPNVRFILATTEPQMIIDTIHSRCITFKFNKVDWQDLYTHVTHIAKLEQIDYEDAALKIACKLAKGSVRNALQNIQTALNYVGSGGKITEEAMKDVLQAVDDKLYYLLVQSMIDINMPTALKVINAFFKDGKDAGQVLSGFYTHMRYLMLGISCPSYLQNLGLSAEEIKRITHQAKALGSENMVELFERATKMNAAIALNVDPIATFEKMVIEGVMITHKKV